MELGFDEKDLEKLILWKMPFGRYKGLKLIDLPEEYLFWFQRDAFPKGELGRLMQISLQLKIDGVDTVVKNLKQHYPD